MALDLLCGWCALCRWWSSVSSRFPFQEWRALALCAWGSRGVHLSLEVEGSLLWSGNTEGLCEDVNQEDAFIFSCSQWLTALLFLCLIRLAPSKARKWWKPGGMDFVGKNQKCLEENYPDGTPLWRSPGSWAEVSTSRRCLQQGLTEEESWEDQPCLVLYQLYPES